MADKQEIMKFPCTFPIKIMGINNKQFIAETIAIVASFSNTFNPETDVISKPSEKGNYLSITATIEAQSKDQLDNIYLALNKHKLVKITL